MKAHMSPSFFEQKPATESPHIKTLTIPHLPPSVDIEDIKSNFKLFSDNEVELIKELKLNDGRHSKHDVGLKYTLMNKDGEYYAIYKGFKYKKQLGDGAQGRVKLAQNLRTADWYAIKIGASHKEALCLDKLDQLAKSQAHGEWLFFSKFRPTWWEVTGKQEAILSYLPGVSFIGLKHLKCNMPNLLRMNICIAMIKEVIRINKMGICHDDLFEGNMMYNPSLQQVHLIDFGRAKRSDDRIDDMEDLLLSLRACGLLSFEDSMVLSRCEDMIGVAEDIKASMSDIERVLQMAVLNVDDLDKIKDDPKKMKELQYYTQVILVDNRSDRDIFEYMKCQHFLEKNSIYVANNQVHINLVKAPINWASDEVKKQLCLSDEYGYQIYDAMSGLPIANFESQNAVQKNSICHV